MPLPNLRLPRDDARKKIEAQLNKGREIRNTGMIAENDLERNKAERSKWVKYTRDLLELLFDNSSMADEFDPRGGFVAGLGSRTFRERVDEFRDDMDLYITRLESIHERLDLAPQIVELRPLGTQREKQTPSTTIFISHSSEDVALIDAVKQAFEDLPLTPLFNEKQPTGGPPASAISERIEHSKAVFVFFTTNSMHNMDTRDWIIFELGLALAHGKKIYSWKDEGVQVLPRLVEQVTTHRPFETYSSRGTTKLTSEVRRVAKELSQ